MATADEKSASNLIQNPAAQPASSTIMPVGSPPPDYNSAQLQFQLSGQVYQQPIPQPVFQQVPQPVFQQVPQPVIQQVPQPFIQQVPAVYQQPVAPGQISYI